MAQLSDPELQLRLDTATALGQGIGGAHSVISIASHHVFVKRIPLTDRELEADNVGSTSNLFDLPLSCQYGIGSPSLGAWRELAANRLATEWAFEGRLGAFALLYHWRVLEGPALHEPLPTELADIEATVAFWDGSPAVRRRIEALRDSAATLALFFEYIPAGLPEWLTARLDKGGDAASAAIAMVQRDLEHDIKRMNGNGLFHFDTHLDNIRTDGQGLYLTDFGLATSSSFALTADKQAFLTANADHDVSYALTRFVDELVMHQLRPPDWQTRDTIVARVAAGETHLLTGVLPAAAEAIRRHAPMAAMINEFYRQLRLVDRQTPFPPHTLRR